MARFFVQMLTLLFTTYDLIIAKIILLVLKTSEEWLRELLSDKLSKRSRFLEIHYCIVFFILKSLGMQC